MFTPIVGSLLVVCSLFVMWWALSGEQRHAIGLSDHRGDTDLHGLRLRQGASERLVGPFAERVGHGIGRVLPAARVAALRLKLQRAGSPDGWTAERVVATKILLALVLGLPFALRALLDPSTGSILLVVVAVLVGFFLPDGVLDRLAERRSLAIRLEVADTIDQLSMMVRAGLGIDAAIARVARTGTGPLAEEFARVVQDMRVGAPRVVALTNMSERTGANELRSFTAALAQAEQLGVPVATTLELQADELRVRRHQLAEEQAMKLPVKILFPMVLCLLPVLLIVLLAPAAIRIFETF